MGIHFFTFSKTDKKWSTNKFSFAIYLFAWQNSTRKFNIGKLNRSSNLEPIEKRRALTSRASYVHIGINSHRNSHHVDAIDFFTEIVASNVIDDDVGDYEGENEKFHRISWQQRHQKQKFDGQQFVRTNVNVCANVFIINTVINQTNPVDAYRSDLVLEKRAVASSKTVKTATSAVASTSIADKNEIIEWHVHIEYRTSLGTLTSTATATLNFLSPLRLVLSMLLTVCRKSQFNRPNKFDKSECSTLTNDKIIRMKIIEIIDASTYDDGEHLPIEIKSPNFHRIETSFFTSIYGYDACHWFNRIDKLIEIEKKCDKILKRFDAVIVQLINKIEIVLHSLRSFNNVICNNNSIDLTNASLHDCKLTQNQFNMNWRNCRCKHHQQRYRHSRHRQRRRVFPLCSLTNRISNESNDANTIQSNSSVPAMKSINCNRRTKQKCIACNRCEIAISVIDNVSLSTNRNLLLTNSSAADVQQTSSPFLCESHVLNAHERQLPLSASIKYDTSKQMNTTNATKIIDEEAVILHQPNHVQRQRKQCNDVATPTKRNSNRNFGLTATYLKSHLFLLLIAFVTCGPFISAAEAMHTMKYSTNVVKTKYGQLRGIVVRSNPTVEAYLGVPYATPPVGSLR